MIKENVYSSRIVKVSVLGRVLASEAMGELGNGKTAGMGSAGRGPTGGKGRRQSAANSGRAELLGPGGPARLRGGGGFPRPRASPPRVPDKFVSGREPGQRRAAGSPSDLLGTRSPARPSAAWAGRNTPSGRPEG